MTAFAFKRVRTAQELRDAADALTRAGYSKCGACGRWSNEDQRCEAFGSARDTRCAHCGVNPALLVED